MNKVLEIVGAIGTGAGGTLLFMGIAGFVDSPMSVVGFFGFVIGIACLKVRVDQK